MRKTEPDELVQLYEPPRDLSTLLAVWLQSKAPIVTIQMSPKAGVGPRVRLSKEPVKVVELDTLTKPGRLIVDISVVLSRFRLRPTDVRAGASTLDNLELPVIVKSPSMVPREGRSTCSMLPDLSVRDPETSLSWGIENVDRFAINIVAAVCSSGKSSTMFRPLATMLRF